MMHYLWQHLDRILSTYDGRMPLHHFLRGYFAQHKKLGSRDRRGLSDAAYAWYRAGKMFTDDRHLPQEQRLAAMHICGMKPKAFAAQLKAFSVEHVEGFRFHREAIFPYNLLLSDSIDADDWRASMLRQPRLFLRIRKGYNDVEAKLNDAAIPYERLGPGNCLALPNGTHVEDLLPTDVYVVQDASSQATGAFLKPSAGERWWDCCSGAGGKSLMLLDAAPSVHLTATDIRASILQNLKERIHKYGQPIPETFVLDAADEAATLAYLGSHRFDGIICDVPCTGSGTWARTPENCYFFDPASLTQYTARQKSILRNAAKYLAADGRMIYITCSVFRAENEEVLAEVAPVAGLRVISSKLINGIPQGADSLFVAVLQPHQ